MPLQIGSFGRDCIELLTSLLNLLVAEAKVFGVGSEVVEDLFELLNDGGLNEEQYTNSPKEPLISASME